MLSSQQSHGRSTLFMAKKKAKPGTASTRPQHELSHSREKLGFFPFAQYTSVVGVHTTLLAFTALFLPRTNLFLTKSSATQMTSRDRPQHPFVEALTTHPLWTMTCVCGGVIILQVWWGRWMRNWAIEFTRSDDKKLVKTAFEFTVSGAIHSCSSHITL
jgi:phosphatidylinositol glycan class F